MPGAASPAHELCSSAFMSFWMNTIGVEVALLQPLLSRLAGQDVDGTSLLLTLLFLHLCVFFSPAYASLSRGACNNPTVYFLFYLTGEVAPGAAVVGVACVVLGTIAGTFAYAQTLERVIHPFAFPEQTLASVPGKISAVVPAGGAFKGAAAEAGVAFANFVFAGVAQRFAGHMAPYAGAFFYVITVVLEKCAYSCGFMNPAVVLATHVVDGDLFDGGWRGESLAHVGTYFCGAALGAAATAAFSKALGGGAAEKEAKTREGEKKGGAKAKAKGAKEKEKKKEL